MSKAFDLEKTYLSLDGGGEVAMHPVGPDFWATIDANPALKANLMGVYSSSEDWPHWELHPKGDEILVMLEGEMILILRREGGEERVPMRHGEALVVPKGVAHRALVAAPCRFIGVTYGEGTEHIPL